MESDAIFFNNEDVSKEFAIDEHYIDPIHNRHVPSFRMVVDYHEGYVVLVYARDEKHLKQIWLVKALSSPKFVQISPNFHPTEVQYCHPSTKDHNVLHTYLGWDTKNNFKWTVDLTYGPIWINTNIILCAWKPHKGSKLETMIIPLKHIDFVKYNLARIATVENNAENGYEAENRDGKT